MTIVGDVIEQLVGIGDVDDHPEMIMMKLRGRPRWQRFFLEYGEDFWEEYDEADMFAPYDGLRRIDFGQVGAVIESVVCMPDRIELALSTGVFRVVPADASEDPDMLVTFTPR
jgi:hypothetical protein